MEPRITYPVVLPAKRKPSQSAFRIDYDHKGHKTGPSEIIAFSNIVSLGLKRIRPNVSVTIGNHRYEPDLAYVDKTKGIFIDIEIDEPYSAKGVPTHYVSDNGTAKDHYRNEQFRQVGWHVVRFSERQMFCQTASCMRIVFQLLKDLGAIEALPKSVAAAASLHTEPCRTKEEALQLLQIDFRKSYLGFNPNFTDIGDIMNCFEIAIPILRNSILNKDLRAITMRQFSRLLRF